MGDLFGFLLLLLLEKETVQDRAEQDWWTGSNPIVDQQPLPFCCLQRLSLRLVFLYRSDGETPSRLASVRSCVPPTVKPYVRSSYSPVDLDTSVLIPRSLSQCNLLGVRDAGGWLRLAEREASRPAQKDRSANASGPCQPDVLEESLPGPYAARSWGACEGSGQLLEGLQAPRGYGATAQAVQFGRVGLT